MDKRFIVTDHNYLNTGGNCMVSIFAVYDAQENVSRWVIANEEGFNYQTADTISSELQLDSDELIDKIVLGAWQWDALVADPCCDQCQFTEDEFELFKYCEFEFYKKDCKYFNSKVRLATNQLPAELFNKLSPEYIAWANLEGVGCLTDGYDVFMDDNYEPPVEEKAEECNPHDDLERQLQEIKNFKRWFNDLVGPQASEEDLQKLYDGYITIAVAGNSVKLPFDANVFSNINHTLRRVIEEW